LIPYFQREYVQFSSTAAICIWDLDVFYATVWNCT